MSVAETIQRRVEDLGRRLAAGRSERQQRTSLDPADFTALRETGFHQLALPVEMGGAWTGAAALVRPTAQALRGLAAGDPSVALVACMHPAVLSYWLTAPADLSDPRWRGQRQAVLASPSTGALWGTMTSEPGSGGDISLTRATAVTTETTGRFLLSGTKHFGSGSGVVTHFVTTARPVGEQAADWFFLEAPRPPWDGSRGLQLLAPWEGHGMKATQSHAFELTGCPAERFAWQGHLLEVSRRAGPYITCLFAGVILGVVDAAVAAAGEVLARRAPVSGLEIGEWIQVRRREWLVQQAFEGMLRSVESEDPDQRRATLQGKCAIAELGEECLTRICRLVGGAAYSRRSPFGHWLEDVRALGFLRPPWTLAAELLGALEQPAGKTAPGSPVP